ncbi:MAG TPA: serine/threonine-protein kinase, partial [Polyangiaceae bacterium]|nr:serine/threonine-protein kinase [Polyangiaceae bacterium]
MSKGPAASDDQDASPEITVRAPVVGTAVTLLSNPTALDGDTGSLALGRDSIPPPAMINTPAGWPERFTLGRVLGAGATSLVLAAKDEELHRDVAIKLLRTELVHDAEARARFEREAGLTGNLEHPNIAPVYDIGKSEGLAYLVMRQVRGRPLGGMIRRARDHGLTEVLPINDLINIFLKVCDAVSYAHDHGLLHRDIKPDNILVGDHGEVVLVDWGAASTSNDADPAGTIVGTPHYMAPERVTGQPASVATDVFALGASMFYAFVLRRPLEGLHGEEFWRERLAGTMLPLTSAEQKRVPRQ